MACFKALSLALGLRFAAGAAAHPTGRRFEQKWSGSYRLGAGYRTRAQAGLARIIFLLAHETTEPSRQPSRCGVILYETAAASGQKKRDPAQAGSPSSVAYSDLPLGDHRRRGLALADLGAAGDAQECEHRGHSYSELLHGESPSSHDAVSLARNPALPSARKAHLGEIGRCPAL